MSTHITTSDMENFFIKKYHTNKITLDNAKNLGIDVERYNGADENDDQAYDLDEIGNNDDLLAAFTSIVEKELEADKKSKEEEKEEQNKVQEKNGAGV